MEMRSLNKGEVCTYRVKALCGAPVFTVMPAGSWGSKIDNFNITWVEFEVDADENNNIKIILNQYEYVDIN